MKFWEKIKKAKGFSMMELTVSLGISSFAILAVSQLSTNITKSMKNLESSASMIEENSLLRKVIISDLLRASPSFNFLKVSSFDTIPNTSTGLVDSFWKTTEFDVDYSMSITLDKFNDQFNMIITDSVSSAADDMVLFVDPKNITDETTYMVDDDMLKDELAPSWLTGQTLKFKALQQIEDRDYGFLIKVTGSNTYDDNYSESNFTTHEPSKKKCTVASINTLNKYIGCLPVQGALANFFVTPVKLITYKLKNPTNAKEPGFHLVRVVDGNEWLVAKRVKRLTFVREDLSGTIVEMQPHFYSVRDTK